MAALTAERLIELLELQPHPKEGGFFRETYRAEDSLPASALAPRYGSARSCSTAIYYLLTPSTFSEMHIVATDEVFHFYLGDAVEQLQLTPGGGGRIVTLGPHLDRGQQPQGVVPQGVWQGARLAPGGTHGFALMGATVAPGFDYADYRGGQRAELLAGWPQFRDLILALTHPD